MEEAWGLLARRHTEFPTGRRSGRSEEVEAEAAERQLGDDERLAGQAEGNQQDDKATQAWTAESHQQACAVYEQGLAAVPTPRMYQLYSDYLCQTLKSVLALGEDALQQAVAVAAQLFGLLQRAHSSGCSSPETYLTWADWAEKVQQPKVCYLQ